MGIQHSSDVGGSIRPRHWHLLARAAGATSIRTSGTHAALDRPAQVTPQVDANAHVRLGGGHLCASVTCGEVMDLAWTGRNVDGRGEHGVSDLLTSATLAVIVFRCP